MNGVKSGVHKKKLLILVIAGCGLALLVAAAVLLGEKERKEPVYQGKRLGEWLEVYNSASTSGYPAKGKATEAIRSLGTNALPWLVKWINYPGTPVWRLRLDRMLPKGFLGRDKVEVRANCAADAFEILGPIANPVAPKLLKLALDARSTFRSRPMSALSRMGSEGVRTLVTAMTNKATVNFVRGEIAEALWSVPDLSTNGKAVVAAFVGGVADDEFHVAYYSTLALGKMLVETNDSVAALTEGLNHRRYQIRAGAAEALGNFGESGRSAIPLLIKALDDGTELVRESVTNTLNQIAPEVLRTNGSVVPTK